MKRLSGFSLMEMMVVLLIVSIVAAASAPMINKKLLTAASEKSPWVWTGLDNSIAYNLNGADAKATIGRTIAPAAANDSRLYIDSRSNGTQFTPQLAFGQGGSNIIKLRAFNRNFIVSSNNDADMNSSASNAVAIGFGSYVDSESVAIGRDANSADVCSVAVGANSSGDVNAVAVGFNSTTRGEGVAVGTSSNAFGAGSIAIGFNSTSSGANAISIGNSSSANITSIAIGNGSNASFSNDSVAVGNNTTALNASSVAIGNMTTAALSSVALGLGANASSMGSVAIGPTTTTEGSSYSIAIGSAGTVAANGYSIALGYQSFARGSKSIAIGNFAGASHNDAIAIGHKALASGESSIAIGSHQTLSDTKATGNSSIAIGDGAHAEHEGAVAIGWKAGSTTPNQIVLGHKDNIVYIPGKLVVNGMAVLGYANGASTAGREYATVIRSIRGGGIMEVLDRDGDGDWDAVHATSERVDYSWASGKGMSDRRLKNVGKAFIGGLKEIKQLETFNYTFKKDPNKTPRVGVMAQDLQKIFPQAVFKGEDGFLRIRMEDMFYALINAVKELDLKFASQDKKIEELTKENQELKKTVATLEKRLEKIEKSLKNSK